MAKKIMILRKCIFLFLICFVRSEPMFGHGLIKILTTNDENRPKRELASTSVHSPASETETSPEVNLNVTPMPDDTIENSNEKKDVPVYTLFGDIRHRSERLNNEDPDLGKNEAFEQTRIRARLGVKAQPVSDTSIEFRLATGPGGTSTNQNYGETSKGFRNYDFKLDRAFAKYSPFSFLNVAVGRMAVPFVTAGDNDMLFDFDLNIDGSLVALDHKSGKGKIYLRVGQFFLEETKDSQSSSDVVMSSSQIGGNYLIADRLILGLIATRHQFGGVKDHLAIVTGDFGGNSNSSSRYTYNYDVTSLGVDVVYEWVYPITLFYEGVVNEAADSENRATLYGLKLGKLKNAGDWIVSIDSREIRKDAALGLLVDSDSYGGGTNGRNIRTSAGYNINKFLNVTLSNYSGEKNIQPSEVPVKRTRWHLDLNIKF